MVHFLTARHCALQAAPWSQLSGGSKPNSRATTPTMPAPNHPQPAANAKIIVALFPLSCQLAEAAPLELSHQQRPTLRHLARATTTHFGGAPDRYLAGVAAPREARNLTAPVPSLHRSVAVSQWAARRPLARTFRDQAPAAANFARRGGVAPAPPGATRPGGGAKLAPQQVQAGGTRRGELLRRQKGLERYRRLAQY